jgi:hypothetical protein
MFIILFAILAILWLGGFLVFHVSSGLITPTVAARGNLSDRSLGQAGARLAERRATCRVLFAPAR